MIKFNNKDIIPKINSEELSRVVYNGKVIFPLEDFTLIESKENVKVGDICCNDTNGTKEFLRYTPKKGNIKLKNYNPIGIVVMESSHTPNNSIRIMGLKVLAADSPKQGIVGTSSLYFGAYGYAQDLLTSKKKCVIIGNGGIEGNTQSSIGLYDYGGGRNIPSDLIKGMD